MSDDLELLREATKAAIEYAERSRLRGTQIPGQSQFYDPETNLASVYLDGDGVTIDGIPNHSGSWPYLGERVMCEFVPPQGLVVSKVLKPVGPPNASFKDTNGTTLVANVSKTLSFDTFTSGRLEYFEMVLFGGEIAIQSHVSGWFDLDFTVAFASAATGRRFIGASVNDVNTNPGGLVDLPASGATGPVILSAGVPIFLNAEDYVKVRAQSGVGVVATVQSIALEWRDRQSIWFS